MNTSNVLRFVGWASLTYMWLESNCLFFNAIADAINHRNEQIRQKAIDEVKEFLKQKDESESEDESGNEGDNESESEDESEDKSEVVVEKTVTKTILKS